MVEGRSKPEIGEILWLIMIIVQAIILINIIMITMPVFNGISYSLLSFFTPLLCILMLYLLYINANDKSLKNSLIGLILYLIFWTIAGFIQWTVKPSIDMEWINIAIKMAILAGYLPLISALNKVLFGIEDRIDKKTSLLVSIILIAPILPVFYYILPWLNGPDTDIFSLLMYFIFLNLSLKVMSLSLKISIIKINSYVKYFYLTIFTFFTLTAINDIIHIFSLIRMIETLAYEKFAYAIMFIFLTVVLLFFTYSKVRLDVIDEISKKFNDSRRFMNDLLLQSPDAVCIFDKDGRLLSINGVFMRMFGLKDVDIAGKYNLFYDAEALGLSGISDIESVKNGRILSAQNIKVNSIGASQKLQYVSIKVFPTYDSDGNISGYISIIEDTTGNVSLEKDLKNAYDKLKEEYDKKLDLTNIAAHELKTPLTPIIGYIDLMKSEVKDETHKKYLEIIERNAYRQKSIVDRMLSLSRIDSGKVKIENSEFNIGKLINDVIEDYMAMDRKFFVEVPEGETIFTDRGKLFEVIENLVSNAVKYSEDGTDIIIKAMEQNGSYIFSVKDNGQGIPESEFDRIFERFYIGDINDDKRTTGRTGLGLALIRGYVRMLGGHVWLESEKGKGSTFYFSIPVQREKTSANN